ncbi:MAG TPA: glycosyltransferase family 1 protein [Fluviicola sp.]|nr:glycosyltransferase family 1 protein [Fluviicola sp.]
MRIAINTRFLLSSKMEGFGWYTYEVVKRLVEQHPEHTFVFFLDRAFDPKFVFGPNVTPVVLSPPARHPILFYIWFEWSVKRALRKHNIDVFFSPDGYLSLGSGVPQVGVIHDLNFEHYPQDIPWQPRWYLRRFFPKFARKATQIVTVSEYSKQDICATYGIAESRVTVGWNGASELFQPLDENTIADIRKTHSSGNPYFIFVGALHPRKNVGRLLEAYGKFCEQNAAIDLVIVGETLWKNNQLQLPDLSESVKNRIHFTGHVSQADLTQLVGAAHSMVYVPYFEGFGIPLVEAMKCGVPIIAGNRTSLPEVAGDAALYCDPFNVESITQAMHQLSGNAELYEQLKTAALERGKLFSWDQTAEVCWKAIVSSVN